MFVGLAIEQRRQTRAICRADISPTGTKPVRFAAAGERSLAIRNCCRVAYLCTVGDNAATRLEKPRC